MVVVVSRRSLSESKSTVVPTTEPLFSDGTGCHSPSSLETHGFRFEVEVAVAVVFDPDVDPDFDFDFGLDLDLDLDLEFSLAVDVGLGLGLGLGLGVVISDMVCSSSDNYNKTGF